MKENISYDRITSLLVESMENLMYGQDSKDGHEETPEELETNLKKAEAVSKLSLAAMEVRRTEIQEKTLKLDIVKIALKEGYTLEDFGGLKTLQIEDKEK